MLKRENELNELFRQYVPGVGKADTKIGEVVRAINRIGYRFNNDGDRVGIGYGRETVSPSARYLSEKTDKNVADIIKKMRRHWLSDREYEALLSDLCEAVYQYIVSHDKIRTQQNNFDSRSYKCKGRKLI